MSIIFIIENKRVLDIIIKDKTEFLWKMSIDNIYIQLII